MRIAHILRKYNPAEWGGTETAVKRLLDGLTAQHAQVVVFSPKRPEKFEHDPFTESGYLVKPFRAFIPVWGLSESQKKQLVAVGGNLLSFDLIWKLQRERPLSIIHSHTLNRLGGIAATVARLRRIPFVVTVHGGVLDLPAAVRAKLAEPLEGGLEWGKVFGWLVRSRRVLDEADAIITCNRTEATLLREKFPGKIVLAQPHGVPACDYQQDRREAALRAFPGLQDKTVLLAAGRIDPVKNQGWLVQQLPRVLATHSNVHLVIAGACTDESYGKLLKKEIRNLGLEEKITLTGGLPAGDPRLIGLFQSAAVVLLPSLSETFGLVILEAWAAGRPVLSSRTSGAVELIRPDENGWTFDLTEPEAFQGLLNSALANPERLTEMGQRGRHRVVSEFDCQLLAKRIRHLYQELICEP